MVPPEERQKAKPLADPDEIQRIAGLGVWRWELSNNLVYCSRQFFENRGMLALEHPIPRAQLSEFVHQEDRQRFDDQLQQALEGSGQFDFHHRVRLLDGQERIHWARGVVGRDANGTPTHVLGTAQDVTDVQHLAGQAVQLKREADFRAEFISKAAHELRTPLLPIRVQTHILAMALGASPDPKQQKALESLGRNLDRLNRLIDDLLDASRLQARRLKLDPIPVELSDLVEDAMQSFRPVAEQLGLRLHWRPRPGVVVEVDPHRLLQVLHNLLGNAMKFTPSGGGVTLEMERRPPFAHLTITDTGPGLTAQELASLFQPFTQTGAGRDSRAPGSGLGLYVSKGIVEEHGGSITAESAGAGKGATFKIRLPLSAKPAQPIAVKAQAPQWWREAAPDSRLARFRDLI